ncbi:radical SAM protein [Odoribacter sp. OttesenSCG-928-A06]|nr:radical SAM protein [Odoribacter sp. OttesenSCG-928-A06]
MLTHRCNLSCIYCYQKHKTAKDMSLETAKAIMETEVKRAKLSKNIDSIRFDMFGGEPLLKFDLIKELCRWAWETITDFNFVIYITTNGTLIDDDIKEWLALHKEKIHIAMSVDGTDDVQKCNRGCQTSELPIDFVLGTLPNRHISMTVSRQCLSKFADEIISFHEQGYSVEGRPAQGVDWQEGDGKIYEAQLAKIAQYYLEHPEVTPTYLFKETSFIQLLFDYPNEKFAKVCGIINEIVAYNVDGKLYPCHHFVPNVHGREDILKDLVKIDFSDISNFVDEECIKCDIMKLCRSCCARNYTERGDIRNRDKRACQMILAEGKVISSYQIQKLMSQREHLTSGELLKLKAAVKCYQLCCDFEVKFYARSK